MHRRRLIWKIAPWYVMVIGLCTAGAAWYADMSIRDLYRSRTARELEEKAHLLAAQVEPLVAAQDATAVQRLCRQLGSGAGCRITIIQPTGKVLGDSEEADPSAMENHAGRPEVQEALAGRMGQATRYSHTLGLDMMYVAHPLRSDSRVLAVVRTSVALADMSAALRRVHWQIALAGLITAAAAVLLTLLVFNDRISRPLAELQAGAGRFAAGRLDGRLSVPDSREIGGLAQALNSMAAQLDEKIRTITRQSQEREAVLAAMIEGVIALDAQERIIALNGAAARLLGLDPQAAQGRALFEIVRNADLQRLVSQTLASSVPVQADVALRVADEDRSFDAHGSSLKVAPGQVAGAVIVLHDVTRLRRLERVRQEFVANVSHELRTPIAAIKAAAETLLEAGPHDASAAERFVPMLARQADRLNAIVEDLLTLARVEQAPEREQVALSRGAILPVLRAASEICQPKAEAKQITITVQAEPALQAAINTVLLEQAVVNLLENAVKYCPAGSAVSVSATTEEQAVVLSVQDNGPGIAAEHLPRLFERFYRPDRGRSREMGGTGLGLAIVKHVAQVHGGGVSVDSTPGKGSVFRIHLPVSGPAASVSQPAAAAGNA